MWVQLLYVYLVAGGNRYNCNSAALQPIMHESQELALSS